MLIKLVKVLEFHDASLNSIEKLHRLRHEEAIYQVAADMHLIGI